MRDNWTAKEYNHFLATGIKPPDSPAVRTTDLEHNRPDATKRKSSVETVHQRVDIEVYIYRHATGDPDSVYFKPCCDALVEAQIIQDDSRKFVRSVRYEEIPCEKGRDKTVIDVYCIGDEL